MSTKNFKPVILVCGKTGVGKTSLIQAVTGRETVPDSAIGVGAPVTHGFSVYETDVAIFIDAEGMEPGKQTVEEYRCFLASEIVDRLASGRPEDVVTNVWYCIDGSGARVTPADRELVMAFGDKVILVITKSEIMRKIQFEVMGQEICSLVPSGRVLMVSGSMGTGLDRLIDVTKRMVTAKTAVDDLAFFESAWNGYYQSRQNRWRDRCDEESDSCIRWSAGRSFAIALPCALPLSDIIPLGVNEAYMIMRIGAVYGETVGKNVITMLTGVAAGSMIGKFIATLMPPGFKSIVAASVTYALGKATKAYFRSAKSLSIAQLREEFKRAKQDAKKIEWKSIEGLKGK